MIEKLGNLAFPWRKKSQIISTLDGENLAKAD
jgi:hypothetical protein